MDLASIAGGLVVSCQSPAGSPLQDAQWIEALARAALSGGAVGTRIDGPKNVARVRGLGDAPVIGLHKVAGPRRLLITPTAELAAGLVAAGADMVAVDATDEAAEAGAQPLAVIRAAVDALLLADVSTRDEAIRAADAGADAVATTLSGYTPSTLSDSEQPDLGLVEQLADLGLTVVAEGRFRSPEQVAAAFDAGAHAVVVGGAITDPWSSTRRFAAASPRGADAR